MQVYALEELTRVDILALTGGDPDARQEILMWNTRPSDVDGCIELHSPEVATSGWQSDNGKAPFLQVLDALKEAAWRGVPKQLVHT